MTSPARPPTIPRWNQDTDRTRRMQDVPELPLLDTRGGRPMMLVRIKMARLCFLRLLAVAVCAAGGESCGQYLEAVVPTGVTPVQILWDPAVNKVYCSNEQDASITVISGETNQVLTTIQVGDYPIFLCLNADGSKLYCSRGEEDRLVVVDTRADTVMKTINITHRPGHMVCNSTMNKLYISCNDDPVYRITVLDATADTVLRYIQVLGIGPLLWNPASNRVFCYTIWNADTMKVIDCATDELVERMPLNDGPGAWCFGPANGLVYLSARYAVHVYSPDGDSEVAAVPGRAGPLCATLNPNRVFAVGTGPGGTVIRIVDGESHTVLDSVIVGGGGVSLVADTWRDRIYFANTNARKVDIIDARADTLVKAIPLGRYPAAICWSQTNSRVYISDEMDNVVYVIRDTSTGIVETRPVSLAPARCATILRQALVWHEETPGELLDMAGRRVATLKPGSNDLHGLDAGVYFLRWQEEGVGCIRKVILMR